MTEPLDVAIARVAAVQCGVIAGWQIRAAGASKYQIHRFVESGRLRRDLPGVFVLPSAPDTWQRRAWAASLWGGQHAALSHRTAATLLELDVEFSEIEMTTTRRRNALPASIVLHTTKRWGPRDLARVRGLVVTSPTRTLIDLGSVTSKERVELALEAALRKRLTSIPTLECALASAPAGRRGAGILSGLLSQRGPNATPTESALETRFLQFARRHRLPILQRQFEIRHDERFIARVDFADPIARVAIEISSYRWHSSRRAWARDQDRFRQLAALGWTLIVVTQESLDHPMELARTIRQALGQAALFT